VNAVIGRKDMKMIETLAVIAALVIMLILVGVIWQEIRHDRKQDAQARAEAEALIARYIADAYPATMSKTEVREMNAGRWG
jgi:hypothetical protein